METFRFLFLFCFGGIIGISGSVAVVCMLGEISESLSDICTKLARLYLFVMLGSLILYMNL